jgi:hypothetical protein
MTFTQTRERERERERESILFKKVARVPSVTDSPMKGTTASNLSPTEETTRINQLITRRSFTALKHNLQVCFHYHCLMQMTYSRVGKVRHLGSNSAFYRI